MAKQQISLRQLAINKDNTVIALVVGLASFIVVFSLIASHSLLEQRAYQAKVIGKKKTALRQVKTNVEEVEKLKTSYQAFADSQENILGGSSTGPGDKDGDNPRLILDSLPSKYDFPALATSMEKVFKPYNLESVTGTDEEIAQSEVVSSGTPQPVEMPFAVTVNGSAQASKEILLLLERSIRPTQVQKLSMTGSSNQLKISINGKTYYQPQIVFDVRTETVK
jgi:hypothetical protein